MWRLLKAFSHLQITRAGDRTRTGDVQLGKLAFYQLNYARDNETTYRAEEFARRHLSK